MELNAYKVFCVPILGHICISHGRSVIKRERSVCLEAEFDEMAVFVGAMMIWEVFWVLYIIFFVCMNMYFLLDTIKEQKHILQKKW